MRLASSDLHFDLTLDEWPSLEGVEIFNQNHCLTYRLAPQMPGAGSYDMEAGGNAYLPMGRVIFIPASTSLRLRGSGGLMTHGRLEFPPGRFPELDTMLASMPPRALGRCMDVSCPKVVQTLHRLIMEARDPDWASHSVLADLGHLLSLDMLRFLSREEQLPATLPSADIAFRDAVERHMQSLAVLKTSVNNVAKALTLSPRQFSRKFREYYGQSFTEYLLQRRISIAASLLSRSNQSLKLIAHYCGYTDHAAFSRHFHAVTGISPTAYRKSHRSRPNTH